jgi:hypothetical protein
MANHVLTLHASGTISLASALHQGAGESSGDDGTARRRHRTRFVRFGRDPAAAELILDVDRCVVE